MTSRIERLIKGIQTESEKISQELFQTTSESKYYLFGVAVGLHMIYAMLHNAKNKNIEFTHSEIAEAIKSYADYDEKIKDYFERLLKDLEEADQ